MSVTLKHATSHQVADTFRKITRQRDTHHSGADSGSDDSSATIQSAKNVKRKEKHQAVAAAKRAAAESGAKSTYTKDINTQTEIEDDEEEAEEEEK